MKYLCLTLRHAAYGTDAGTIAENRYPYYNIRIHARKKVKSKNKQRQIILKTRLFAIFLHQFGRQFVQKRYICTCHSDNN